MKEMNLPEDQFRCWQPRRPSAGLKERLFSERPPTPRAMVWSIRCLAPAAACLLMAVAVINQGSTVTGGASPTNFSGGLGASNEIACIPANYQQEFNRVSPLTFDWTNRSGSTSSIGSFRSGKVN